MASQYNSENSVTTAVSLSVKKSTHPPQLRAKPIIKHRENFKDLLKSNPQPHRLSSSGWSPSLQTNMILTPTTEQSRMVKHHNLKVKTRVESPVRASNNLEPRGAWVDLFFEVNHRSQMVLSMIREQGTKESFRESKKKSPTVRY